MHERLRRPFLRTTMPLLLVHTHKILFSVPLLPTMQLMFYERVPARTPSERISLLSDLRHAFSFANRVLWILLRRYISTSARESPLLPTLASR